MEYSAQQLSDLLGGVIDGDPSVKVHRLSKIEEATAGSCSFLANPKYTPFLYTTKASIVIIGKDFKPDQHFSTTLVKVSDPYQSFARLLESYGKMQRAKIGISPQAFIEPTAKIDEDVYIGAGAYIGENAVIGHGAKIYPQVYIGDNAIVGKNSTLYPGVKVYFDCVIGEHCVIHADVVIGADGFGFTPSNGVYDKVAQIGNVLIKNNVEIGANTTIDRATLGSTLIGEGVKLDNLIQIAHNVEIGENTVIAAQTGIAGSTKIGKNCMIGGQVGIVGHIEIADGVKVAAQSGIGSSIKKPGEIVQGSPAFNIGDFKRTYVVFKRLPELESKLKDVKEKITETYERKAENN